MDASYESADDRGMSCKCQKCGKQYKVDILIRDDLWEKISPKKSPAGMLCGECIIKALEAIGYGAFKLEE